MALRQRNTTIVLLKQLLELHTSKSIRRPETSLEETVVMDKQQTFNDIYFATTLSLIRIPRKQMLWM